MASKGRQNYGGRSGVTNNVNPTDKYVGSRVRMRRLMLGLTQSEVARTIGISFQQLQKYEKGANRISASRLQQLSHILTAPIAFFFDGITEQAQSTTRTRHSAISPELADFLSTPDGARFVKAYMQIKNPRLRRTITQLIEDLSNRDHS